MNNQSLNCILQSAKTEMIKATNNVMQQYKLPPCLMDGILSSLLADIRSQAATEIVMTLNDNVSNVSKEQKK